MHNNGLSGIQIALGGNYEFNHCTIANYNNQDEAISMSNFQCLQTPCQGVAWVNPLKATFRNCLILGNDEDEIVLADWTDEDDTDFEYKFDHCFVQVDELLDEERWPNFFNNCENCLNNPPKDTMFINMDEYDFHLDTFASPIDYGKNLSFIEFDKDGLARDDGAYDLGCYEFQ